MKKIPCKLFHCRNAFQRFRPLRLTEYQQPRQRLRRSFLRFLLLAFPGGVFPLIFSDLFKVCRSVCPLHFLDFFRIRLAISFVRFPYLLAVFFPPFPVTFRFLFRVPCSAFSMLRPLSFYIRLIIRSLPFP